ncbi:hypothetical protein FRC01_000919 [Tulasnella sp. 417]|nr:hypothetical protein FRC01_000919 [Tulasnella sp. 417]
MAETTDAISRPLNHSNLSSNSLLSGETRQTLPLELWNIIYHFLQLDAEADLPEPGGFYLIFRSRAYRALRSLGHTSRSLHQLYLSVSSKVVYITADRLGPGPWFGGRRDCGNAVKTAWLEGREMEVSEALNSVPEPHLLFFREFCFERSAFHWVTACPTVRSLKLLRCEIRGQDFSIPPFFTTEELYSIVDFRKSNVKSLELYNGYQHNIQLNRELALLAFIPSLEILTTAPSSFRTISQLPTTLDLPRLRSLVLVSHLTGSINQTHILSFLRRCPTLETLYIEHPIRSKALEPGELPANMPNLREYEGRPEYLTLIHAPALRRAVVKGLDWDGGALVLHLVSTSPTLEVANLELTARMDNPIIESLKVWMEEAATRRSPNCQSTGRSSLVIRTAPLGDWIYSAKIGKTDSGELFLDYYSRREESMAYLATPVN